MTREEAKQWIREREGRGDFVPMENAEDEINFEESEAKSAFNEDCDKECLVHKLVTHNSCLLCKALRNSPYVDDDLKAKSDKEIFEIQKEIKRESQF